MHVLLLLIICVSLIHPTWGANDTDARVIPECALKCFTEVALDSTCSGDFQCLCPDVDLRDQALSCVEKTCVPLDVLATLKTASHVCGLPVRNRSQQFDAMAITLIIITSGVVCLRYVEKMQWNTKLQVDDYIIGVCLLIDIANTVVCVQGLTPNGLGRDAWTLNPEQVTSYLRYLYVGQELYAVDVFAIKLCVLFFYLRIFPSTAILRLIWATIGAIILSLVIFGILALTQCQPISYYWQGWDGLHQGHCIGINAMAWAGAGVSIILDVWMLALPLSQLIHLQLHWLKKIGVALMFGVGTFVTVVSVLRLRYLVAFGNSVNPTWDGYLTCYWSVIELNVGICCTCMPNLRKLIVKTARCLSGSENRSTGNSHGSGLAVTRNGHSHINSRHRDFQTLEDHDTDPESRSKGYPSTVELVERDPRGKDNGVHV